MGEPPGKARRGPMPCSPRSWTGLLALSAACARSISAVRSSRSGNPAGSLRMGTGRGAGAAACARWISVPKLTTTDIVASNDGLLCVQLTDQFAVRLRHWSIGAPLRHVEGLYAAADNRHFAALSVDWPTRPPVTPGAAPSALFRSSVAASMTSWSCSAPASRRAWRPAFRTSRDRLRTRRGAHPTLGSMPQTCA